MDFLGDQFLPLLALAMGGALAVGTLAALVKPRTVAREGELARPPIVRSLTQIGIGTIVSIWALASLFA